MAPIELPLPADDPAFQFLFHHYPLPMWFYDLETLAILEVNQAAVDKYGYRRDEFLKLTIKDIRPIEDVPRLLADLAQLRPSLQHSGQWRHRLKNGTVIDVDIISHTLTFNGRPAVLLIAQDISQRLQTEAALRRLNRTYAVLSGINQTIVRRHNPQALFEAACRIAVEAGGFRLAWVGMANEATRQIEVVAHVGEAGDYLKKINIALHDEKQGCGPTSTAFFTGQHMVVNVIEQNLRMAPWQEDALCMGYHAVAAFPLKIKGNTRGTFNLYASEAGFFDAREVALLDDLAEDISFALERAEQAEAYRQAENALNEVQAALQRAISAANVGLWDMDLHTQHVHYSLEWKRQIGYEDYEISDDFAEWQSRVHPDDLVELKAKLQVYLQNPYPNYSYEYRFRHKDGSYRWILAQASAEVDEQGQPQRMLGSHIDITERKQTEAQLRLQSAALAAAANAIVITDREGIIQWVNPAFSRLTGYEPAEAVGRNSRDLVKSNQQNPTVYNELWQTITAGQAWHGELVNHRKDGSLYTEEQTITPLRDETGEITYFIAIKQDVTSRRQLEAENRQLMAQIYQAQKMESIGRLAGGIAHDFNNLLVPIVGYTELGMLKLNQDSQLYNDLNRIKGAGERAAQLTKQILAFSRQQMLEIRTLDLNGVVAEFLPMLTRLIGEDITVHTHLTPDLPTIRADKGQLEQVLLNLVVNARDAMPDGGTLFIETAAVTLDKTYVARHAGAKAGLHTMLAVSDTGYGMDAVTQQHIFEPFFTTKGQGRGTGLGLATVFGIVKQHGGNIWVYSEPGRGTTFKIYLPLTTAPVPTAKTEVETTESVAGTETVLLVEDEPGVRQLIRDALLEQGYHVLEAGDPEKGLAQAQTHQGPLHLLLTDVIMPKMNGRELYQKVAASRIGLKVLYMSGYTDDVIAHHHVLDEGVAFLQKPFTVSKMLQKVRTVLE